MISQASAKATPQHVSTDTDTTTTSPTEDRATRRTAL